MHTYKSALTDTCPFQRFVHPAIGIVCCMGLNTMSLEVLMLEQTGSTV